MVLEIEVGEKLNAKMYSSTYKSDRMFAKELEDVLMKTTTNCEENKVDMDLVEHTAGAHRNGDADVNITECTKSGGNELVETECIDTTESSSSFDDCDNEVENLGDYEVLSDFHSDDALPLDFDGFGEIFRMRKKKPTAHWRSFIRPLMWRCKWVELQIKKLEAQARKFERKLEEGNQQKQIQLDKSTVDCLGVKSLPFSQNYARSEVLLRRKKRRRDELTKDVAAYMSRHNLFSYYDNRKYFTEGASMADELKNHAKATERVNIDDEYLGHDGLLCVETGNGDNSLEQIFRKIESLQSQVRKLKSRVDKVTSENGGKFSSSDNSSLPIPYNGLMGSPLDTNAPPNNGDRMPVGTYIASQLISEYNRSDLLVPESGLTSRGEFVPDVNGSTNLVYFADAYGNGDDDVLIDNQRVKEEMHSFEEMKIQPIQKPPLVLNNGLVSTCPPVLAGSDPPVDDQPPLKIRSISNLTASKSKRGRRKGAG